MRAQRIGAIAVAVALSATAAGTSGTAVAGAHPASGGLSYGGFTHQQWPVIVQLSRSGHKVTRVAIGLNLRCSDGFVDSESDWYTGLRISSRHRFRASLGPVRVNHDDGTFAVFDSRMKAKIDASRAKVSGTWEMRIVEYASTGTVTESCDSGTVAWSAKQ